MHDLLLPLFTPPSGLPPTVNRGDRYPEASHDIRVFSRHVVVTGDEHPVLIEIRQRAQHVRVEQAEKCKTLRARRPPSTLFELMRETLIKALVNDE
jgi:hypothetical protein